LEVRWVIAQVYKIMVVVMVLAGGASGTAHVDLGALPGGR
jgi:hypothetical protein